MQKQSNKFPNIKERILYLLDYKGITKEKFFSKIGMTYGNFTGKAKETPLNSTALGNILLALPDASPDWLILGVGPMLRNENLDVQEDLPADDSLSPILRRYEALVVENAHLKEKNLELENLIEELKNK